ncbi:MAG: HAD family phosphatase [candidate division SR1 bacterium]|nr:HAD family phosphatase [candidate division SR1 bacterium]
MKNTLICFDLDGLYFTEQSFQRFKETLAPNVSKEKRDYVLALSDEMKRFKAGEVSEEEYRNRAKKELGLSCANEEIYERLRESYEVNEKVKELISVLKEKGYKTGVCSNNFPTRIRELDKKFNFIKDFDVHIFSYEVGILKPDAKIFQELINKSGLQPHEIIYSDDKEDKLTGAKSLGIQTFVFHSFEEFVEDLRKCGIDI